MADKMILVPHDEVQRLQGNQTSVNALDKEMAAILKLKLSDSEKWTRYNQALQRYMHITGEQREPVKLTVTEKQKSDGIKEGLIDSVPDTYKRKAIYLFERLKSSSNVRWNDSGEVFINGVMFEGSNIIDLINDVLRYRKNFNPLAWRQFSTALKKLNISKDIIGNNDRGYYMQSQTGSGAKSVKWESFKF